MKSKQVLKERLRAAKQEHDIIEMMLKFSPESEREGFLVERAKSASEVKTLEWILGQ